MKRLWVVGLRLCWGFAFSGGCVSKPGPETPTPTPPPLPAGVPTLLPLGVTADETLSASGYGTHEYSQVLMKKGPVTFHATFDGPGTFTMDITLHGADVVQPFYKRGAFDETVTVDIGSTQYYYVTVTGLGNWTVVQS